MRASETYQEWGKNYEKNQNTVTQKRCGYVASNRSRFSKHQMTHSPVFSVHFTNRKNPAKPDYHMSIKKSQAILKCFIDLWTKIAFGLRWAQKAKPCFVTLKTFFSLTVGQGVENIKWPAVPIFSFVFWAHRKPNAILEIYEAFQDRLTFLNRHIIVYVSWNFSIWGNLPRI